MGWIEYVLALALFGAAHRVPASPRLKAGIEAVLGRTGYVIAFSAVSTLLLIWVIVAAGRAPYLPLWDQAQWQRWLINLVMPMAVALAVFGTTAPNPFAFEGRARGFDPARPGIAGVTRQPLLWALALWSGAHLVANGDLAHVILFGLFVMFSLAGMRVVERRRKAEMGAEMWRQMVGRTGLFPFVAMVWGVWRPRGRPPLGRVALTILIWAAVWQLHTPVIGVSPMP